MWKVKDIEVSAVCEWFLFLAIFFHKLQNVALWRQSSESLGKKTVVCRCKLWRDRMKKSRISELNMRPEYQVTLRGKSKSQRKSAEVILYRYFPIDKVTIVSVLLKRIRYAFDICSAHPGAKICAKGYWLIITIVDIVTNQSRFFFFLTFLYILFFFFTSIAC